MRLPQVQTALEPSTTTSHIIAHGADSGQQSAGSDHRTGASLQPGLVTARFAHMSRAVGRTARWSKGLARACRWERMLDEGAYVHVVGNTPLMMPGAS
jgi:hypothetical protein